MYVNSEDRTHTFEHLLHSKLDGPYMNAGEMRHGKIAAMEKQKSL
jgi:hypothetical protein